jgi:glycosyltransferase involved in cell wall biosynthesis
MSVVIVADHYEIIRKTIRHLRTQTVSRQLEIVIVTQSKGALGLDDAEIADFLRVRVVEVEAILPLSVALAAGIRQASAPVIVTAESHSYPGPGWGQALIEAHKQPWVAVGPVIGNANPDSIISWANLFLDYGGCVETTAVGEVDYLPGHNTSYKREIILQYGSKLEAMMDSEILLHWDMRSKGYRLLLEQAAKTYHLNVNRLSSWLSERFYTGRRFAATRARDWSPLRRLLYAGGAPLIPLVRLSRVLQDIRSSTRRRELLPRVVPPLIVGLTVSALGELIGYVFGAGEAVERLAKMELHKVRHVTESDRQRLQAVVASAGE